MRRIAPLSVLTLAVLLGGCGGDPSGNSAPPQPASSTAAASDAPLPRYTSLTDLGAATAAQQKADRTAKITITGGLSGQPQGRITGDGALRYDDAGPAMHVTQRIQAGNGAALELGLVVLPDTAFVRLPVNAGSPQSPGKTWLRVDPSSPDPLVSQFGQLVQAIRDNADPTRSFAQFGDALTIVEASEEPLDGVPAVRYRLRVDLAKAAARQADPAIRQSLQQNVQSGLTTLEYTLWLDAANRTLRVLVDQPLPGDQGIFTLDTRYRDWGQPVQIDPPPADQVATG